MSGLAHLSRPACGLIVLRVDETIEHEFRTLLPEGAARLHVSRIASGDDLTLDSIAAMKDALTGAASLLPEAAGFDVVGYACTSATATLGAGTVAERVRAGVPTATVTDPLSAALAQLAELGAARVGVVSPYAPQVAERLHAAFEASGVRVVAAHDMGIAQEAAVVRIGLERTAQAAREVAAQGVDAVFLSCTNLNTLPLLAPLSADLGVPVLSSNAALAWHMRRLAGIGPGRG